MTVTAATASYQIVKLAQGVHPVRVDRKDTTGAWHPIAYVETEPEADTAIARDKASRAATPTSETVIRYVE